jgi:hypothetical protein
VVSLHPKRENNPMHSSRGQRFQWLGHRPDPLRI